MESTDLHEAKHPFSHVSKCARIPAFYQTVVSGFVWGIPKCDSLFRSPFGYATCFWRHLMGGTGTIEPAGSGYVLIKRMTPFTPL